MASNVPGGAAAAILQPSQPIPDDAISVQGPNFEKPLSLQGFFRLSPPPAAKNLIRLIIADPGQVF